MTNQFDYYIIEQMKKNLETKNREQVRIVSNRQINRSQCNNHFDIIH